MLGRWLVCSVALASLASGAASAALRTDDGDATVVRDENEIDITARDQVDGEDGSDGSGGGSQCDLWRAATAVDVQVGLTPSELAGAVVTPVSVTRTSTQGFAQTLLVRICPGASFGVDFEWVDTTDGLRDLVLEARERLVLPYPAPEFAPPGSTVRTLVGVDTWFWIPERQWRELRESATAGTLTVSVIATPVRTSFDPGNGESPVVCLGPGVAWEQGAESACSYTYQWVSALHPDGMWPATVAVTWEVTWSATNGQGGVLEAFDLVADAPMNVEQAEVVVRRR